MKVRLDENLSWRIARALKAFLSEKSGLEVTYVRDFLPPKTTDPTWIAHFATNGGHAVISGDANILQNWPDLVAYHESGLIGYFPDKSWAKLKGAGRAALLMRWWPTIAEHMKSAPSGSTWRIPTKWTPSSHDLKELIDPRTKDASARNAKGIQALPKRKLISRNNQSKT